MAEEERGKRGVVCVTGAGGFIGSWLVKFLLSQGYYVHGTLRDPKDEKNAHLKKLERASQNLQLFKVNLLDYDSISPPISGCHSVFHVASPVPSTTVPNPEVELMEPAVKGTLNVLKASSQANVKRVVFVSSAAAVFMNPSWPKDQVKDETCWSDKEYCRSTNNWYFLSKTEAESEAWEFAKTSGLDVLTVCPTFVLGPILQSTPNSSSLVLLKLLKEGYEQRENKSIDYVDVRDLAEALILVNEKPEAKGRYICTSGLVKPQDMVEVLRKKYPHYNYPKKYIEIEVHNKLSSEKLQKLGWRYRGLEETLIDSVESYKLQGLLD